MGARINNGGAIQEVNWLAAHAQKWQDALKEAADTSRNNNSSFNNTQTSNTTQPSTLLTEDTHDAQANCLDKAEDYLEALSSSERKNSSLVLLETREPAKDGEVGHAVVRQGSEIIDPTSGKRYDSLNAYLNENKQYVMAGEISADDAKTIFDTPAGSPMRQTAIDQTNTNSLENLQVAKDHKTGEGEFTYRGTPTEGAPKVWVTGDVDGRPDNLITARRLNPRPSLTDDTTINPRESLKGDAVIVDANGNGKIDLGDYVYKIPNGTKFSVEYVDGRIQLDASVLDKLKLKAAAAKNGFDHYGEMTVLNYQTIMGKKSIEEESWRITPRAYVLSYEIVAPWYNWYDPRRFRRVRGW